MSDSGGDTGGWRRAVSDDPVEAIREGFAALQDEGVEALADLLAPEFEFTTPPELAAEPDTYRGREGMRRYFQSFYDAMEKVEFIPERFIAAGERVVVPARLMTRGRASGIETEQAVVMVWTVRDGRAVAMEVYATVDEALAAVGLEPEGD